MIFYPNNNSDINGIIHKNHGINVICSNSSQSASNSPCTNAISPETNFHFCSDNFLSEKWMTFTFQYHHIYTTQYSFQSPKTENWPSWCAPRNWGMEGFKDVGWVVIDNITESGLDGFRQVITRGVSNSGPFSTFRIKINGLNYGNQRTLRIYKIDVFGVLCKIGTLCPHKYLIYSFSSYCTHFSHPFILFILQFQKCILLFWSITNNIYNILINNIGVSSISSTNVICNGNTIHR